MMMLGDTQATLYNFYDTPGDGKNKVIRADDPKNAKAIMRKYNERKSTL